MRVFVTGGTGLLGRNIVEELIARGHFVTTLVRRADAGRLLRPEAVLVKGDLRDVGTFENHLADHHVLVHAGACYGEFYRGGSGALPEKTNVRGTASLLEAAERRGIRNIVYVSSAAVLDAGGGARVNEDSPYADHADDPYFRSKVEAEKAVLAFARATPALRLVLILPTVMLGPGDAGPTPTGAFVLRLLRGEMKLLVPGWQRIVDARDVAAAVAEAMTKGRSGERYLMGGRRYSMAEIYGAVAQASGRSMPTRAITPGKLLFASRLMALTAEITGRPPIIKPHLVRRLQASFSYDSTKAGDALGARFRPLSETMTDTVRWFQAEHGDLAPQEMIQAPAVSKQ
jgi:nucleoside-diphosphate-sugar epimerase